MGAEASQQDALTRLTSGQHLLLDGQVTRAAELLVEAEAMFGNLQDAEHAAESRAALAEAQRQNGALEQAMQSYERAITLYKEAGLPAREASATLALGHLERQLTRLDGAWQRYYLALRLFEQAQDLGGQATAALALGHIERQRGRFDRAAEYYQRAREHAAAAGDGVGEADAARGLGEMLESGARYTEAAEALARAMALYTRSRDRYGEIDTLLSQGRLATHTQRLDEGAALFGQAVTLATTVEYPLGYSDGLLGLAEVSLRRGRLDQALAHALLAEEQYSEGANALGQAEANRVLGEVHLLRGQLGQALTVFERAMRACRTLRAQVQYAQAAWGAAEAQRRRGNPTRAEDLFTEARQIGGELAQSALEASATLGLGQLAVQRGRLDEAERLLNDAAARYAQPERHARLALALLALAQVAQTRGELDRAAQLLSQARDAANAAQAQDGEPGPVARVASQQADLALTLGQFAQARVLALEALRASEGALDVAERVEAQLVAADLELESAQVSAAVTGYNRAQTLAHESEATVAEALAGIGLARVLLHRELWEEAANAHQELLARLRLTEDAAALSLAQVGLGEARRNLGERAAATAAFNEAIRRYAQVGDPLGEADALQGKARLLLEADQAAEAHEHFARAMSLVERVGSALAEHSARLTFFDARASLYSDAICLAAQHLEPTHALDLARHYGAHASKTGQAAAAQHLREFEQTLTVRDPALPREEADRRKAIQRTLQDARAALEGARG